MRADIKILNDSRFKEWILVKKVRQSQLKAVVRVNKEMLRLYWDLGEDIVKKEAEAVWWTGIYDTMSRSLKDAFPSLLGFSVTNLKYMKRFYLFYSDVLLNHQQPTADLEVLYSVP